jgi:hypothetical protein
VTAYHSLQNTQFKAQTILARYGGYSELHHAPDITDEAITVARELFALRTKKT